MYGANRASELVCGRKINNINIMVSFIHSNSMPLTGILALFQINERWGLFIPLLTIKKSMARGGNSGAETKTYMQ
jgi:hypothetical protein